MRQTLANRQNVIPFDPMDRLLDQARQGSRESLGLLLESCRHYLRVVASRELPHELHAKLAPADLTQETFLDAIGAFRRFRGRTRMELLEWLRSILLHNVIDAVRHFEFTDKCRIGREISLDSTDRDHTLDVPDSHPTPFESAVNHEEATKLNEAIEDLPLHYRIVFCRHHHAKQTYAEIGQQLGRSSESVRKLWTRAIRQLQASVDRGIDEA